MLPRLSGRVHARFLPPTCPEHVPTQLDAEGRLVAPQAGQNDWGKRLDFATWLCAWRQYAIGAPFDEANVATLEEQSGARQVRVLRPGTAATMDYRDDRLNIHLESNDMIESLRCG